MSEKYWEGLDSSIASYINEQNSRCLASYKENPLLVEEHTNIELATSQGGYGKRQIYELIQNGADALINQTGGRVEVILDETALYCANEGEPFGTDGVSEIMSAFRSSKRGAEIGRFGLGFKSVLGVTTRPQIFSRSGSFEFDDEKAGDYIDHYVSGANRYPVLRIAFVLDPEEASRSDDSIAELMNWADTIVKLPLNVQGVDWLAQGISQFPSEFLLFSPHVGVLVLEDRVRNIRREISVGRRNGTIVLTDSKEESEWNVLNFFHNPSEGALKDAGEMAKRETVQVYWAIPKKGRFSTDTKSPGQFWAFFPTHTVTKLSGIVNAPWKTNEDRQNLLEGEYNYELIDKIASFVAENLESLVEKDNPVGYLDVLPGRRDEYMNWADDWLNQQIYEYIAHKPCLPDMNGVLCRPSEIKLHPAGIPTEALERWRQYGNHPVDWVHHEADTYTRRPRVERLMRPNCVEASTYAEWLEIIANDGTPEASLAAISSAAIIVMNCTPQVKEQVQNANILLDNENNLIKPLPGTVFIPTSETENVTGIRMVHPDLVSSVEGKNALAILGIYAAEAYSRLQAFLVDCDPDTMTNDAWDEFWQLVSYTPADKAVSIIKQYFGDNVGTIVKVKTILGSYHPVNSTLLPGPIVPSDGSRDAEVAIDVDFHKAHLNVLEELGASETPKPKGSRINESWFDIYLEEARERYFRVFRNEIWKTRRKPKEDLLNFDKSATVGPLLPLERLGEEGKALFTKYLLQISLMEGKWFLLHSSSPFQYPKIEFKSPPIWMANREGRLETSQGIQPLSECVGPELEEWSKLIPVADCSEEVARLVNLTASLSDLTSEQKQKLMSLASESEDSEFLGRFYSVICEFIEKPEYIRLIVDGSLLLLNPSKVCVITDRELCSIYDDLSMPYLLVIDTESANRLIMNWGMLPGDTAAKIEIVGTQSGTEVPIIDKFLGLSQKISDEEGSSLLIPCDSLCRKITTDSGTIRKECVIARDNKLIYFSNQLSNDELLEELTSLMEISLSEEERENILDNRALTEQRERTLRIRLKGSVAEKLVEAVGTESIRRRLPTGLVEAAKAKYGDFEENDTLAAELILAVYGIDSLRIFRDELRSAGLSPPLQWADGNSARRFVRTLGFPDEYAGFGGGKREGVLEIEGPPNLPPLHEFQEKAVLRIKSLLQAKEDKRGLLALPTGAGKTRVAVESLIRSIRDDGVSGPILWVAQSDELCEQAVQAWSEVWRSIGNRSLLRVNRLWGANEAQYYGDGMQVVVATIDKMHGCIDDPDYDWLSEPTCLIIDEAHGSIATEYSRLLRWLGLERNKDIRTMIGLTATPFRGSEDETQVLVRRFFGKRLDEGILGDDPYKYLQDMGVISRVEHCLLDGVEITDLNEDEISSLKQFNRLPATAADRIGSNSLRNEELLKSIADLDPSWTVILFAVSVDHANTMAALLNAENISAAAISSATDYGARRYYVKKFRDGEIRVLTNYGVLTAGFDAPSTRAIYVARPVFSPVLYQQMIGRGLRGPLNGGKEVCLIVNVNDNFEKYGESLAFTEFEPLWSKNNAV